MPSIQAIVSFARSSWTVVKDYRSQAGAIFVVGFIAGAILL